MQVQLHDANIGITHWLKNVNEPDKDPKVWRYAHYSSYTPWASKRSVMISTLKKVNKMASNDENLVKSAYRPTGNLKNLRDSNTRSQHS